MKHESAIGHVTGRAVYTDEQREPVGMLRLYPVQAPHAHARIIGIDATAARARPGVLAVLTAPDIPGDNNPGTILHDEPLIPADEVSDHGQPVAWVGATDVATAQVAARLVRVDYQSLPACLSIDQAIVEERFHMRPARVERGDVAAALAAAPHRLKGEVRCGGQDHFYLETHASWVAIDGDGIVHVSASTQHPSETQAMVAHVLGIPAHRVVCRCLRMGGGFGGKETQANPFAAIAALAALRTGHPVGIQLPRGLDMQLTGKRHPFLGRFEVGFDADGQLLALDVDMVADGGWSCDLSPPVLMRAIVHVDNAYHCAHVRVLGRIAKTNVASNTAFRGFGGPQGMLIGEEILDRVARHLQLPPEQVRERNFYRPGASPERNTTHYGQPIADNHMAELWSQLLQSSDFARRRGEIDAFNAAHATPKRGLAITPVKFGISFNKTEYNQAGALVLIYQDGSIQLNHGGTEMGQGLHTKMIQVAARTLGVARSRIQIMATSTDKVPNTSATAASSGSDLNGQAIKAACETLLARLAPVAAALLGGEVEEVVFADDRVSLRDSVGAGSGETDLVGAAYVRAGLPRDQKPEIATQGRSHKSIGFTDVVKAAYNARISLSSTGYYRTPVIHWDAATGKGHPFYYFAYGAAVCETEVCAHTGVHHLRRVDVLHDVGESLNEGIDRGQIEGGFVQGLGWLTCEELRWNSAGKLLTDAPSTYKIPTVADVPTAFKVDLYRRSQAPSVDVIFGSKAVGEPPLMLALAAREALRDAVAAFGDAREVLLDSPATPEAVFRAIERVKNCRSALARDVG